MKLRCKCSRVEYRKLQDKQMERRMVGKKSCPICKGSGCTLGCQQCMGAGLNAGKRCEACGGHGRISAPSAFEVVFQKEVKP